MSSASSSSTLPSAPLPAPGTPAATVYQRLVEAGEDAAFAADCACHFSMVLKWNRTHNLTRIVDPEEAAALHYLDCARGTRAAVAAVGWPTAIVDVGSGAGFPGVVAALWLRRAPAPASTAASTGAASTAPTGAASTGAASGVATGAALVLVEPARKRASFLTLAGQQLRLPLQVLDPVTPPAAWTAPSPPAGAPLVWVTTRATFSAGERRSLWPYLLHPPLPAVAPVAGPEQSGQVRPVLCAWTTPHERSTWEKEVATWSGWSATAHRYDLHVGGADRNVAKPSTTDAERERILLVAGAKGG